MDKKYKLLLLLLGIYIVVMVFLFFINNNKEQGEATVFIDNYSRFIYSDNKWSIIPSSDIERYNWKKYDLYRNQELIGNYYLMKSSSSDKFHIFDDSKKSINWERGTIAFGGNIKTSIIKYEEDEMDLSEYKYASFVLKTLDIEDSSIDNIPVKNKYSVDLDDDGEMDNIYSISNTFMEGTRKKTYSVVFLHKNNKNIVIYKNVLDFDGTDFYQGCRPSISTIFKLDDYKNPNIVVSCAEFSAITVHNYLYNYDISKNTFSNLITNSNN